MNQNITGTIIRELRIKNKLTQLELADKLHVSDKTISKWETGKGYPDITLLEPIAKVFGVSITEILSGNAINNMNVSANMLRSKFYVCPICGNVINSTGESVINCHGIRLLPLESQILDEEHDVTISKIEDEYYVSVGHDMSKEHYISFIAALSPDRLQLVKLYPEGNAETRFKMQGVRKIYLYCNRDGLFSLDIKKI